jgi:hypothetical protein
MSVRSSAAVARAAGVSYRRLDYWARCGYLHPDGNGAGCGTSRRWPQVEVDIAALMVRLIDAGFVVPAAAALARDAVEAWGTLSHDCIGAIAPGIVVIISAPSPLPPATADTLPL